MNNSASVVLRKLIEDPEPLMLPYGACAFHTVMAEKLGFKAIALSGAWATTYLLGRPDVSLISLTEMANVVRYMVMASDLPVIADCDQGFGNAINTYYSVKTLINAGAAGLHIEDQPYPKRCGFVEGKELISREEMVGKLRAARDAKREMNPDFLIIARVDALTAAGGGFDETVRRARAYRAEGGADVIYIEGAHSVEEIGKLRDLLEGPLFCSTFAIEPHPSVEQLRALGQCVVQMVNLICEPAVVAAWDVLADVQQRGLPAWHDFSERAKGHPLSRLGSFDLVGMPNVKTMEEKYLPGDALKKYEESTGLYKMRR